LDTACVDVLASMSYEYLSLLEGLAPPPIVKLAPSVKISCGLMGTTAPPSGRLITNRNIQTSAPSLPASSPSSPLASRSNAHTPSQTPKSSQANWTFSSYRDRTRALHTGSQRWTSSRDTRRIPILTSYPSARASTCAAKPVCCAGKRCADRAHCNRSSSPSLRVRRGWDMS